MVIACSCTSEPNGTRLSPCGLSHGDGNSGYDTGPPCTRPSLGWSGAALALWVVVGQGFSDPPPPGLLPSLPSPPLRFRTTRTITTMITTSSAMPPIHQPSGERFLV